MLGKLFSLGSGAPSSSTGGSGGGGPGAPAAPTGGGGAGGSGSGSHDGTGVGSQGHAGSLESVQEDMHTRNLLFPDADALFPNRNGQVFPLSSGSDLPPGLAHHSFDDGGDLDLDVRDVRVLIMQDALSSSSTALLYDSHAPPQLAASDQPQQQPTATNPGSDPGGTADGRRMMQLPTSPRKGSVGSARGGGPLDSPQSRQAAFDRRASLQGCRPQGYVETEIQRAMREYREELSTFSGCAFGNSELMAYKGTSTKVHVVPCGAESLSSLSSSSRQDHHLNHHSHHHQAWAGGPVMTASLGDGRGSVGRSRAGRGFSQSYTSSSETMSPTQVPAATSAPAAAVASAKYQDRQKVLITRLFPVTLPADDEETAPGPHPFFSPQGGTRLSEDMTGFPFPHTGGTGNADPSAAAAAASAAAKKKKPPPRQKRTPMYAIVLVVNLPQPAPHLLPVPPLSSSKTGFRPGSYTDQDSSFPSSYGSTRRTGWTGAAASGLGPPPPGHYNDLTESAFVVDVEDRIDALTRHWDIIMRTLTNLQSEVAVALTGMLRQASVAASLEPYSQPRNGSLSGGRVRVEDHQNHAGYHHHHLSSAGPPPPKPSKSSARLVFLQPNCLAQDKAIGRDVDSARNRIVTGLAAARVVTGQGRWGIWRDEVRSLAKMPGMTITRRDHAFFFSNILTGFLSAHTDWLQALSPAAYRRRHLLQQRARPDEDLSLTARTVIIANDKMLARRLIFLLSAFLPTNQHIPLAGRAHRPSTAASSGPISNSPPLYVVPLIREESLRKRINRRGGCVGQGSHSRTASHGTRAIGIPAQLAHLSMEDGSTSGPRRDSEAGPGRPLQLPSMLVAAGGGDRGSRKSTAVATAIAPETTFPHFSIAHRAEDHHSPYHRNQALLPSQGGGSGGGGRRPRSTGSVAADDLKRSLQRGESACSTTSQASSSGSRGQDQGQCQAHGSRWGSVISGLWMVKRTAEPTGPTGTAAPTGTATVQAQQSWDERTPPPSRGHNNNNKLGDMVREAAAAAHEPGGRIVPASPGDADGAGTPATPRGRSDDRSDHGQSEPGPEHEQPDRHHDLHDLHKHHQPGLLGGHPAGLDRTPDPTGAFMSPIKTSINAEDGVIDVDVPFPDFITSFETAVSSPSSSGYLSTPGFGGLDSFEHVSRMSLEGDLPVNVAGWLPHYHPDFALQATPPQDGLLERIKASLRTEPSPSLPSVYGGDTSEPPLDRWVDVSTAIIADTTCNSVKRIRYRRLIRPKPAAGMAAFQDRTGAASHAAGGHASSSVYYGGALLTPSTHPFETQLEEFIMDPVMTVDEILAEAVDRIVSPSFDSSSSSSSNSSITPTVSQTTTTSASQREVLSQQQQQHLSDAPREQCRTVVLSALETVIRVTIELAEKEALAKSGGGGGGSSRPVIIRHDRESILREAVRDWLRGIDMGE